LLPPISTYFNTKEERIGLILKDDSVVELRNVSPQPDQFFDYSPEEFSKLIEDAKATWHTHPSGQCNLSIEDRIFFLSWPKLLHYIVGGNDIWCYRVLNGMVVLDEKDDHSPRSSGGQAPSPD
jgi:proteasome lid subunit RPN8/RPN11